MIDNGVSHLDLTKVEFPFANFFQCKIGSVSQSVVL